MRFLRPSRFVNFMANGFSLSLKKRVFLSAENHSRVTNPQAGGMVKQIHKRDCIGIALATIVLISLYAGYASPLVNAAGGDSATNVRASALAGTTVTSAPAACAQSSNSLDLFAKGTGRRPLVQLVARVRVVCVALPRRESDLVTRRDVTRIPGRMTVFVRGSDGAL